MNFEKDILPDNSDELKNIIYELQRTYQSAFDSFHSEKIILQNKLLKTESKYRIVQEQLKAAVARFFSPKKDKVSFEQSGQLFLFNEAETYTEKESEEISDAVDTDSDKGIIVKSHTRKKGGKKRIPDDIPAEGQSQKLKN